MIIDDIMYSGFHQIIIMDIMNSLLETARIHFHLVIPFITRSARDEINRMDKEFDTIDISIYPQKNLKTISEIITCHKDRISKVKSKSNVQSFKSPECEIIETYK